jgi:rod shape-determining protein MreD
MPIKGKTAFWISLFSTLLAPLFLPKFHLLYFAPYLAISIYQHSRFALLWRAYGCGIILDLLSSAPFFGLTALNYCLVCSLLYGQRHNFFEDKLSTFLIMTSLFSFFSTLVAVVLSLFAGTGYGLTCEWVVTDLVGMSFVDGLYALLVFSLPFQLTYRLRKMLLKKT